MAFLLTLHILSMIWFFFLFQEHLKVSWTYKWNWFGLTFRFVRKCFCPKFDMKVLWLSVAELETRTTLQRSFGGLFLGLLYLSPRTESQTELKRSARVEKLTKGLIGKKSLLSLNPNGALLLGLSANYGLTKPILQSAKKCFFFSDFWRQSHMKFVELATRLKYTVCTWNSKHLLKNYKMHKIIPRPLEFIFKTHNSRMTIFWLWHVHQSCVKLQVFLLVFVDRVDNS